MTSNQQLQTAAEANWQTQALIDLETTGLSYRQIGEKYGRSRDTIIKLKRLYAITRKVPVSRKGQQKTSTLKSLSTFHRALGSRLTMFRGNRNYTEVSHVLGISRHVLKLMEIGAHDFTLTQLNTIAVVLGQSISEIIAPITGLVHTNRPGRNVS